MNSEPSRKVTTGLSQPGVGHRYWRYTFSSLVTLPTKVIQAMTMSFGVGPEYSELMMVLMVA